MTSVPPEVTLQGRHSPTVAWQGRTSTTSTSRRGGGSRYREATTCGPQPKSRVAVTQFDSLGCLGGITAPIATRRLLLHLTESSMVAVRPASTAIELLGHVRRAFQQDMSGLPGFETTTDPALPLGPSAA